MSTEYDRRRPRLTLALAERIDAARGQVPFDRWVRMACVLALEQALVGTPTPEGADARTVISPAPARAPDAPAEVLARPVMPKVPPEDFGVPEKKPKRTTTAKEDLWARQQKLNQGKYGR